MNLLIKHEYPVRASIAFTSSTDNLLGQDLVNSYCVAIEVYLLISLMLPVNFRQYITNDNTN